MRLQTNVMGLYKSRRQHMGNIFLHFRSMLLEKTNYFFPSTFQKFDSMQDLEIPGTTFRNLSPKMLNINKRYFIYP